MDDLLTPVKTVRNVKSNIEKFEILSSLDSQAKNDGTSTKRIISQVSNGTDILRSAEDADDHAIKDVTKHEDSESTKAQGKSLQTVTIDEPISSPEEALAVLREQPTDERFQAVMCYLENGIQRKHGFNIHIPSAPAAQILNVLATKIVPDRWEIVDSSTASKKDRAIRKALLVCMSSTAGIGALTARIQSLLTSPQIRQSGSSQHAVFKVTVSFFASMVYHNTFIRDLLNRTQSSGGKSGQEQAVWAEATSLFVGSKILNVFLEASAIPELRMEIPSWLQDPRDYSGWLGVNIAFAAISIAPTSEDSWKMLANLLKRALSLGSRDELVVEVYTQLLLGNKALWTPLRLLCSYLPRLNQKTIMDVMLQDMSKKFLSTIWDKENESKLVINGKDAVGGVASIVSGFIGDNEYLEAQLIEWLTSTSSVSSAHTTETRRAMILVLSTKEGTLRTLLEKSMKIFSDKLHIKHDSMLQQEALAQVILLTTGYLHRMKSQYIFELSRSTSYLQAVSNRLAASLPQARFLGMVVGMAISRLVDQSDKIMKFDAEEMEGQEAEWWFTLTIMEDVMGSIDALTNLSTEQTRTSSQMISRRSNTAQEGLRRSKPKPPAQSKIISIEEVDDNSEREDDLTPYQKPDDDPEDSDEDPTLINRFKPKPPVYIHDLIKALNVVDKSEVIEIALKTAPSLIRRKANFGTELSENSISLAISLINLQDGLSTPALQELRLQSLIACLVSQPNRIGPWITSIYFTGDFSLSQRAMVLTVIGLSSRELAGHQDEDAQSSSPPSSQTTLPLPPSKLLPPHLASLYQSQTQPLTHLSHQIQHSTLHPLTLAAADSATGPQILKLRPFSSRLAKKPTTAISHTHRIPKDLHKILSEALFLPLCSRMAILLSSGGGGPGAPSIKTNNLFEPQMMKLFLQTLTVLLTSLGPWAVQLPALVRETVVLLTALQRSGWGREDGEGSRAGQLCRDPAVLPALLTLLLVVLDVCGEAGGQVEEGLVVESGMGGLVEWVRGLEMGDGGRIPEVGGRRKGEGAGAGGQGLRKGDGEGMPWSVVAAGIQVKWFEIGRKFQGRMMMGLADG